MKTKARVRRGALGAAVVLLLSVSAVAVLLSACTASLMHRDEIGRSDPAKCGYRGLEAAPPGLCGKYTIEHHEVEGKEHYLLGVIEIDDQGWFHHAAQMNRVLQELESEADKGDLIVPVFVHGWKHNAAFCDPNITCFRAFLEQLVHVEGQYHKQIYGQPGSNKYNVKPRRVFGIYIGWRGLSLDGPDLIRSISFWDRKATATQVALGSVREVFARLKAFQDNYNNAAWIAKKFPKDENRPFHLRNRLVITGHSFGGLIVYTSVAQYLMNSAVATKSSEETAPVKGFGDLVLLINPAFEGARYEPLHRIAVTRKYPPHQDPVFVAVTSVDDDATGTWFPRGRVLNSVFDSYTESPESPAAKGTSERHTDEDQRQANRRTLGHSDRYVTHVLEATGGKPLPKPKTIPERQCVCPYRDELRKLVQLDWKQESEMSAEFGKRYVENGRRKKGWQRDYVGDLTLRHLTGTTQVNDAEPNPDSPFWIVRTDQPIVIGHNDFWTVYLLSFLRQVYDDTVRKRDTTSPATQASPAAQTTQRANTTPPATPAPK